MPLYLQMRYAVSQYGITHLFYIQIRVCCKILFLHKLVSLSHFMSQITCFVKNTVAIGQKVLYNSCTPTKTPAVCTKGRDQKPLRGYVCADFEVEIYRIFRSRKADLLSFKEFELYLVCFAKIVCCKRVLCVI